MSKNKIIPTSNTVTIFRPDSLTQIDRVFPSESHCHRPDQWWPHASTHVVGTADSVTALLVPDYLLRTGRERRFSSGAPYPEQHIFRFSVSIRVVGKTTFIQNLL